MDLQLTGKKAIVTGASRGIGRAIVRQLALEGCDVAICARTEGPLKQAAAELAKGVGPQGSAEPVNENETVGLLVMSAITARTSRTKATAACAPDVITFVTDARLLGTERDYPSQPFGEVMVISGARGGKDSRIAAPIVVYEAIFGGHERRAAKGEVATIVVGLRWNTRCPGGGERAGGARISN